MLRFPLVFLGTLALFGCSDAGPTLVEDPLAPFPARISELGVFDDVADRTLRAPAVAYSPSDPLYSNALDKERAVVLPPGTTIDEEDEGALRFPVGTLLFKTFVATDGDDVQPIETRVLRLAETGWEYAGYRWDEDGRDGVRLDLEEAITVRATVEGDAIEHAIPSRFNCRQCHESNETPVIGLAPERIGGAVADSLFDAGVLSRTFPAPAALDVPAETERAMRYAIANCTHCHNGMVGASRAFDLRPAAFEANLIDVPTTGIDIEVGVRIAPGAPDESVLLRLLTGEAGRSMPPIGAETTDDEGIAAFRAYILSLDDGS